MKLQWKNSTKILAVFTAAGTMFMSWLVDPQNLAAVQRLLAGHTRALVVLGGIVALYNLVHEPKTRSSAKH